MLQIANAFFKLPGDYLKPGEDEVTGMRDRMNQILAPNTEYGVAGEADWEIGDCIAQWWRPNFETFMVSLPFSIFQTITDFVVSKYPYVPAHIAKPKECKSLYMITLPERSKRFLFIGLRMIVADFASTVVLSVPKNMKLLAIPLFELYDNSVRYGPQLAAIPHLLSRYNFIYA
jgi:cleavage and polyadenylation specificity factor subunit 5